MTCQYSREVSIFTWSINISRNCKNCFRKFYRNRIVLTATTTSSTEQSSWKTESCSSDHEIPRPLYDSQIRCRVRYGPTSWTTWIQSKFIRNFGGNGSLRRPRDNIEGGRMEIGCDLWQNEVVQDRVQWRAVAIHFNIILHFTSRSDKWSGFSTEILYAFLFY